jgi:hypothetical protein
MRRALAIAVILLLGISLAFAQNSDAELVRKKLMSIWRPPVGARGSVVFRLLFKRDGSLAAKPSLVQVSGNDPLGPRTAQSVLDAIQKAQPFAGLNPANYDNWKDVEITFDPHAVRSARIPAKTEPKFDEQAIGKLMDDREKDRLHSVKASLKTAKWSWTCNGHDGDGFLFTRGTPLAGLRTIRASIGIETELARKLVEPGVLHFVLSEISNHIHTMCEKDVAAGKTKGPVPSAVLVGIGAPVSSALLHSTVQSSMKAWSKDSGKSWTLQNDGLLKAIVGTIQREEQVKKQNEINRQIRVREAADRQRVALNKLNIRKDFERNNSVKRYVSADEFFANPFLIKDQIVGVRLKFIRMISTDEALFGWEQKLVLLNGVPATRFSSSRTAVVALRSKGTTQTTALGASLTLPYGSFVAAFDCNDSSCNNFFD